MSVKMRIRTQYFLFALVAYLTFNVNVRAFDDSISVIGRIKWNYTSYEESLWTLHFKNTTREQIYRDHTAFIDAINKAFDTSDGFYPTADPTTTVKDGKKIINPYNVPEIPSVIQSNAQVAEYWSKFSNWSSYNMSDMLDVLSDDAIPTLQTSLNTFWNSTNTDVYFDFLDNKSLACFDTDQLQLPVYRLVENMFLNTIVIQLKAYVMLQLSYLTRATKDYVQFHKKARDQRVLFNDQFTEFTQRSEDFIWDLSRIIWRCDEIGKNESYTQLTNFIQGYVDNEINLNPDGSCAPYCTDYKSTKNYGCQANTMCATNYLDHNKTRCEGTVRDCDYFGPSFSLCPNENDSDLNRRLNFVKMASGRVLGREELPCDTYEAKPFRSWMMTCRYCFCYCDDPSPRSDRHFSLRDVTSNINENKVISGVRIVKKNGIIHLTATERELLPKTQLNATTRNIVSNHNFTINDSNVKENSDYFTMTYDNRTLNLDTIIATSRDQLVTGVRFRVHSGSVHLEVRFTYYDEATGKLDLSTTSEWKMNSNTNRTVISTEHADIPTKLSVQSTAITTEDNSVKFMPTSWMRDMAQTTVPFFDSISVESPELVPLSGVGLFYKYQPGHGGYVAPKLITPDYSAAAMRVRAAVGVYGV